MPATLDPQSRGAYAAWARALGTTPKPIGREGEAAISQEIERAEQRLIATAIATRAGQAVLARLRDDLEQKYVRVTDLVRQQSGEAGADPVFDEATATLSALASIEAVERAALSYGRARQRSPNASAEQVYEALSALDLSRQATRKLIERLLFAVRAPHGDVSDDVRAAVEQQHRRVQRAKNRFVHANVRLVASVARRPEYQDRGLDFLDLVQEGTFGLMQAVDGFDWRRGLKLSTYATWWIRQALQRALAEHSRTIRLPFHVNELLMKIHRVSREHAARHGSEPTHGQIAAALGLEVQKIEEALEASRIEPRSLDAPLGGAEDSRLIDLVADEHAVVADDAVTSNARARVARGALSMLSPRDQLIVRRRFGLDDGREYTLAEIGAELGLTRERVRQLEARALAKLQRALARRAGATDPRDAA
ncbi:MAG: sigma-70 family RNA polymerase sigma factor [Deltaproteobacteria bacterium]|nr:sigma-70 family RNA polymerase sigma factor [Deltaproteobacteria bacterium]